MVALDRAARQVTVTIDDRFAQLRAVLSQDEVKALARFVQRNDAARHRPDVKVRTVMHINTACCWGPSSCRP